MANGNFGGGTGTISDPMLVEDIYDFRAMNDDSFYYKLVNDININDSVYADKWTTVTLGFMIFDGDGHTIKNLIIDGIIGIYVSSKFLDLSPIIENLNFENLLIKNNGKLLLRTSANCYWSKFKNCKISMYLNNISYTSQGCTDCFLDGCSISIRAINYNGSSYPIFNLLSTSYTHYRCMFYIDIEEISTVTTPTILSNGILQECAVIGKIRKNINQAIRLSSIIKDSYYAISTTNVTTIIDSVQGICFCDKDILNCTPPTSMFTLTTAQCKDVSFLNSIGFLCAEG